MSTLRHPIVSALGYGLLAVGLTWPLALDLGGRFAGNRPLDIWSFSWNLWWVRHALTTLHTNPFVSDYLYYPDGAALYLHTVTFLPSLLAVPAGLLWDTVVAYNLSAILALALAGWATDRLARRWTGPVGAAAAGLAFAAAPWGLHQLRVGHLNLVSAGWLPLGILLLLRATDTGRWRDRLLAALGLVCAALTDWQWALFLAVAGGIVAAERLLSAPPPGRRRRLVDLAAVGLLSTLLLSPLLLATLRQGERVPAADMAKFQREQIEYSADLAAYLVPQMLHPLWGRTVNAWLVEHPLGSATEGRVGLSLAALALAAVALAARRPGAGLWAVIGLAGLLLSLGPRLQAGGGDTGLPLPYALVADLPILNVNRTPARFAVLPALAVAVLAGIGLTAVTEAVRRRPRRAAQLVPAALAGLLAFELLPVPYPTTPLPPLALAGRVRAEAGAGTLLELPYGADDTQRMFFQTVHARPIFEGYTARRVERDFLERTPVLADLMRRADEPDIVPAVRANPLGVLATYRVALVAVYRPPYYPVGDHDRPLPTEAILRRRVQQVLGLARPIYEDDTGALYRVPPAEPVPVLGIGEGWFPPEQWAGGWMRWLGAGGEVRLDRPGPEPVRLTFMTWSYHRPRTLTVLLDGRPLATEAITLEPRSIAVTVPPGARTARLRFAVAEGAESPAALGQGVDPRPLAIAVADLRADRAAP